MATKNNPGQYDCYANAGPDEPLFTLLGRDPMGPHLVELWRLLRAREYEKAKIQLDRAIWTMQNVKKNTIPLTAEKSAEAAACVRAMLECPEAEEAMSTAFGETWFPRERA
jgi:hypothetical protein